MTYEEFRILVFNMRTAQMAYAQTRSGDVLAIARKREAAVDKALREYGKRKRCLKEKR